jgi:AraC-like DNA-binding protein
MMLYIKYMVSLRCKLRVKEELDKRGLAYETIELGVVKLDKPLGPADRLSLKSSVLMSGLELLVDKKAILIERIKTAIIGSIRNTDCAGNLNFSDVLSQALDYEYNYLSNNFSRTMGVTIGQYVIAQKIEMAKEYLLYDELNLTEIAHMLHYSSVGHLSRQFKDVTGVTPSYFKQLKAYRMRIALEDI